MYRLLIIACVCLVLAGCKQDDPRSRPNAKSEDFQVTTVVMDDCTYKVFKQPHGQMWDVVSVVHDPQCKNPNCCHNKVKANAAPK